MTNRVLRHKKDRKFSSVNSKIGLKIQEYPSAESSASISITGSSAMGVSSLNWSCSDEWSVMDVHVKYKYVDTFSW